MRTFAEAIRNNFHNGFAKNFCQELSFLCAHGLFEGNFGLSGPRATVIDGFRLARGKKKIKGENQLFSLPSTESETSESIIKDGYSIPYVPCHPIPSASGNLTASTHYAFGQRTSNYMVVSTVSRSPLIMFECKSNARYTREGLIQLVSQLSITFDSLHFLFHQVYIFHGVYGQGLKNRG